MTRDRGGVIALFGPTGVGKTAIAGRVARILGTRVISCDSMQLYRGLPVLTNQPTEEERKTVPHVFVGEVDSGDAWSAAVYGERARAAIDEDLASGGWAVVAGGTGLYLRAALAPLAIPGVHDPALRMELNAKGERDGAAALYSELARLDPEAAAVIHPHNMRRVVRALEVALTEGPGNWTGREDLWAPEYRHPTLLVGLTMERDLLYSRIDARVERMLREGAMDEVAAFRAAHPESAAQPRVGSPTGVAKSLGFEEICAYLDGHATLEETATRLSTATRRYAKRQGTWLRRLRDAVIIDTSGRQPDDVAREILMLARQDEEL